MDELSASRRRVKFAVLLASSLVVLLAVGLTTVTMPRSMQVRAGAAPSRSAAAPRRTTTTVAPAPTVAPATTAAPTTTVALTDASLASSHHAVVSTTSTTVVHHAPITPATVRPAVAPAPPTTAPPVTVAIPPSAAAVLACIRQRESGGNYGAVSASGIYRGAYQFSQATWNSAASHAGRPDLVGRPPNLVAPADQDAVALSLYEWQGLAPWGGSCG